MKLLQFIGDRRKWRAISGWVLAGLLLLGAGFAARAQTNTPPAAPHYFLFVVDVSRGMAPMGERAALAVADLIQGGFSGKMQKGDIFTIWTYNDQLDAAGFQPHVYDPDLARLISNEAFLHLQRLRWTRTARFGVVVPDLQRVAAAHDEIGIYLISDGSQPLAGTPFDAEISALYREHSAQWRRELTPSITALIVRHRRILDWAVGVAEPPGPVKTIAKMPVPEPPPKPPIVKTEPAPVLATNRVANVIPPKPAPEIPPKNAVPNIVVQPPPPRMEPVVVKPPTNSPPPAPKPVEVAKAGPPPVTQPAEIPRVASNAPARVEISAPTVPTNIVRPAPTTASATNAGTANPKPVTPLQQWVPIPRNETIKTQAPAEIVKVPVPAPPKPDVAPAKMEVPAKVEVPTSSRHEETQTSSPEAIKPTEAAKPVVNKIPTHPDQPPVAPQISTAPTNRPPAQTIAVLTPTRGIFLYAGIGLVVFSGACAFLWFRRFRTSPRPSLITRGFDRGDK